MLTAKQERYVRECTITPFEYAPKKYKYIVQTPMGFHAGSYLNKDDAEKKVLSMAKNH